jgi:hypothetical protein
LSGLTYPNHLFYKRKTRKNRCDNPDLSAVVTLDASVAAKKRHIRKTLCTRKKAKNSVFVANGLHHDNSAACPAYQPSSVVTVQ